MGESAKEVLVVLRDVLELENPKHDDRTVALNKLGASIVNVRIHELESA